MSDFRIETDGFQEMQERMRRYPQKFQQVLRFTFRAVLIKVWQLVPSYPSEPVDSTYDRTGTLGRSLGSSEAGGTTGGRPDIMEVQMGTKVSSATFGTKLEYAPYVIGPDTQAEIHRERWWTMLKLMKISIPHVIRIFERMTETLTRWLDGKAI